MKILSPCSRLRLHQALGATDMGMTFRVPLFGTPGPAQQENIEKKSWMKPIKPKVNGGIEDYHDSTLVKKMETVVSKKY